MFDLKYLRYPSSRSRSSRLLFNFDFAFSVSMLQLTGCPPQAFSRTTAVLRTFVFMSFRMLRTICCTKQFTLLQMTPLLANIFDQDHRILAVSFAVHRYCPPRYLVTLSLPLCASFNRAYTSGPSSCCPTDHVNRSLSLQFLRRHRRHLSLLSYPLALVLSLSLSLSSATSTSQITASKPRRSSAPREGVLS